MASDDTLTQVDEPVDGLIDLDETVMIDLNQQRYERVGSLGRGGMGEIQLCKDTRIARQVAMKLLRKQLRDDPSHRERFLFRARLQGQLEHPSIVPVHDLGETADGELYFTMKRIRGVTLAAAMDSVRDGRPSTYSRRRLLTAFSSVCLAVDFAHSRGVVHRDLKPQNIMLGDFGEVYILDWGIAKVVGHQDTPIAEAVDVPGGDTPTRAGSILGTPLYMAPERRLGHATPATDVFSLGVILGQILETDDEIAPELASISRRATEQDPTYRFKSVRELHDAIERFLDGDRDLEARRKLAMQHVEHAESALASKNPEARAAAARGIGRALGLDPSNQAALRILMRLLSDMPAELPPAAQAEIDKRWFARRTRTMRIGAASTLSLLLLVPFILWLGVRSWPTFAAFVSFVIGGSALQWFAGRSPKPIYFAVAFVVQTMSAAMLTTSLGLLGIVPAAYTIAVVAWRQTVHRTASALLMLFVVMACLVVPLMVTSFYTFEDNELRIVAHMHAFPPGATLLYMIMCTFGVIAAASIYGRLFVNEIRNAEAKLTFQAWQLQQLLPPV